MHLTALPLLLTCAGIAQAVTFTKMDEKPGIMDNGTFGPEVEIVHLYYDIGPIGITVAKNSRAFITYNRGDLADFPRTLGEITGQKTEVAYPNQEWNSPPTLVNTTTGRALGASYDNHFVNVQAVVLDPMDRMWILDTGRPGFNGSNLLATPGGPKLMGFDITTNATTPFKVITFPENVLPPDGYLNDIRFDLRANYTGMSEGVAYIADSGACSIIVVNLATGESWRHLDRTEATIPYARFLPTFFGIPTYAANKMVPGFHAEDAGGDGGADGIAISNDGQFIYFTTIASRTLWRVETSALRVNPADDNLAWIRAANSLTNLGESGGQVDGLESDDTGLIYVSSPEHNAIFTFDPTTNLINPFVRSPVIAWPDTLSVADDGFMYFNLNQLFLGPAFYNGSDLRTKPYALARVKIPGKKIRLM
ncbi:major royal jelly protein-domain-containing protein [Cyathus striatus]|nr:major royal jelly protein-domain-containing protein [Cyathus striatus]